MTDFNLFIWFVFNAQEYGTNAKRASSAKRKPKTVLGLWEIYHPTYDQRGTQHGFGDERTGTKSFRRIDNLTTARQVLAQLSNRYCASF